ncbi:hypothetical protein [Bifidobacterium xylocopae]|uniref:hypothetical protein n=1 Tax=Bifidobacterium xylocopae TaxID=2493119 RepID=UPI001374FEAC|nr:hypothetical protein [Bifidobacterium xylocopae]
MELTRTSAASVGTADPVTMRLLSAADPSVDSNERHLHRSELHRFYGGDELAGCCFVPKAA